MPQQKFFPCLLLQKDWLILQLEAGWRSQDVRQPKARQPGRHSSGKSPEPTLGVQRGCEDLRDTL